MVGIFSFFSTRAKSHCGRMLIQKRESLGKLVAVFYVVLAVPGATGRANHQFQKTSDQIVQCGPYAVCDLASHFCDTVMNTCVRCSDDCHPGRIGGDSMAEEDCKRKCKVYYELKEESDRLIEKEVKEAKETKEAQPIVNLNHRSDEKYLQLSVRSLNLINAGDDLTLARVELLMAIETIGITVIAFLLFIIAICLIILLQRQRIATVHSYSSLDTGRKT